VDLGEIIVTDHIERESCGALFAISFSMFGASMPFCLIAPPTPTLFGVFAFHRRSHPLNKCFCNSSSFHPCMHWKGPRLLPLSRAQETSCCTTFHTVSALSFIWELFFSLHLLSHYSTSLDPSGTPAQSPCALVQFRFSRFLPILCFYV